MSEPVVGEPVAGEPERSLAGTPRPGMREHGRYAAIEFLTWLPTGLMLAPMVLLMSARGLDIAEVGLVGGAYSVTIVVLELPTGGLADVLGRRPVLAASAVVSVAGLVVMALAHSVWPFLVASVLKGVARALSSGPAQAWYVDTLHARYGPAADLKPGLAAGNVAGSAALALGTLAGGLLPLAVRRDPLAAPVWAGAGAAIVLLVAVLVLMREPSRTGRGPGRAAARVAEVIRDVPVTIVAGIRLGLADRALGRLLLLAAGAGVMLNSIEMLTPGRLAALTGGSETGGATYAFVTFAGFAANALGSSLAPPVARLVRGSVRAAASATVVTGAAVVALAASTVLRGAAGVVATAAAYVLLFTALAVASLLRSELLHQRVAADRRATVMSVDSLQLQFGGMLSSLCLVPLAGIAGVGPAWALTAVVVLASALLYVRLPAGPALRYPR
ncbi:MFS transporter [Microbispora sp. GKU 823]|uniref:MFS transporter n=1 Tax=Microbispora sp. GKU 823 TaxID=1652100 RepID=UPI0009A2B0BB|nr:MFS transporter [Microbispora sp. GKU 823]